MRTLLLLFLFIAVPLASGSLRLEEESRYWQASGLDLKLTQSLISNAACHSDRKYFESCRAAVVKGANLLGHRTLSRRFQNLKFTDNADFDALLVQLSATSSPKLPLEMLLGKMITAQLQIFDPFARIVPTDFVRLMLNGSSKSYVGYGLETEVTGAGLFIFRVVPNSVAAHSGLRPNDRIVSIDGIMARNLEEASYLDSAFHQNAGTEQVFEIERAGRVFPLTMKTAAVTRAEIEESRVVVDGQTFVYLRILSFGQDICPLLRSHLDDLQGIKVGGVTLDLRHNPGGMFSEGRCVARLFLGDVEVVKRTPIDMAFPAPLKFTPPELPVYTDLISFRGAFVNFPLVVLIDAASASMSEIVAASLQSYERGWIVGERSYGKSLTQMSHRIENYPKLQVFRSVSRFELPPPMARAEAGVAPDFTVAYDRNSSSARRNFKRHYEGRVPAPIRRIELPATVTGCMARKDLESRNRQIISARFGFADEQMAFALSLLQCQGDNAT